MRHIPGIAMRLCAVALAAAALAGCYGTKILKAPINSDLSAKRLDTLQTQQEMMLSTLERLGEELRIEREERMAASAGYASRLSQIEEALDVLSSKIDDSLQLMQQMRTRSPSAASPRPSGGTAAGTSAGDSARTAAPGGEDDEEALFRSSSMDLTLGNYTLAMQGFKNYIARYPNGVHLDEVHYSLGECQYASEQYLEAAGEYQLVINEFPQSRLAPAAYLKTGLCYAKLDEPGLAEKSFRELISLYPHSEEAQHARAALEDLGG
ncbi:MAG: tetratricopeptide repeat protein [Chitinivibrionia bacterium]|nr:tetratricopeptide repeat protein [Chitinivibrionia bacterium]